MIWRSRRSSGPAFPPRTSSPPRREPDPDFPTVAFPNPEQPGALDLALADARRIGADLVLANDPDGDRLAVAVPDRAAAGGWRVLTGDQLGALLGGYVLERTAGEPDPDTRIVVSTIVSSTLLSRIAAAAGARYAETLTGFKWIVRGGERQPGSRFVFGYEEALGYVVGDVVRDKDGIGAALAVLGLAATARSAGASLLDTVRRDRDGTRRAPDRATDAADRARQRLSWRGCARLRRPRSAACAVTSATRPGRGRQRAAARRSSRLPAERRPGGRPAERHRAEAQGIPRDCGTGRGPGPHRGTRRRRRKARPAQGAVGDLLGG